MIERPSALISGVAEGGRPPGDPGRSAHESERAGSWAGHESATSGATIKGPPLDSRIAELSGGTLVELLDRAASRTPGRVCLVHRHGLVDERWTYRELQDRSRRVAVTLSDHHVGPGDRVVTWGPNDPWMVASLFALWRLGAISVPLDVRMLEDVAVRIARRTQPRLVLAAAGLDEETVAAMGATVEPLGPGLDPSGAKGERQSTLPLAVVTPEMPAEIVFTSGTTSDPKGVVLTHGQVVHSARVIAQTGMGPRPERALSVIPLSHMYGQIVPLFLSLISGSTLVFQHALNTSALSSTLQRERITALTAVPQLAQLMFSSVEAGAARRGDLGRMQRVRPLARRLPMRLRPLIFRRVHRALGGHLEIMTSGGAYLPMELQQAWEDLGVCVVQGYGGTECAAITGHSRSSRRPGSAGPPLAGLEIRIDPDGELLVRGPSVMDGYWNAPEATAEVLNSDGWLHTGDAARIDDGEVVILGRTRDRIALPNGFKVYPEDVESALRGADVIRTAVALESPVGRIAAVLLASDEAVTDEELGIAVRQANATLAIHQRVSNWERWPGPDLPRTHTFKVRREVVKAWHHERTAEEAASDALSQVDGPSRTRQVGDAALTPGLGGTKGPIAPARLGAESCQLVAEVATLPGREPPVVTPVTTLDSLDLDSLRRVMLALRIEEALDVRLPDEEIAAATDVGDLAQRIATYSGRPSESAADGWAFARPARLVRELLDATLTAAWIRIVARPQVEGLEHLADLAGPVLICPNHSSHLDGPIVRHLLPRSRRRHTVIAAAADYWFSGRLGGRALAATMGAFPFGRTSDVTASLERVVDCLSQGWSVVIFPEGTRSPDGRLGPMRDGIGLLASSVRVPVIPVHISGTFELLPKGRALPRRRQRAHVRVRVGAPLTSLQDMPMLEATRAVGDAIRSLA